MGFCISSYICFCDFYVLAISLYGIFKLFKVEYGSTCKEICRNQNYVDIIKDKDTIQIVVNTLLYIFILVIINFVVPYILSFVNTFVMKRGKSIYKSLLFIPSLISLVVGAIALQWIFNPISGPISGFLSEFGISMPTWSKTKGLVIFVISLVAVLKSFGYNF